MKTLKDFDFRNQRVIVRVDFNVKLSKKGEIEDDTRIRESLPTLNYILSQNPKQLIIMSHLGSPEGKAVPELRMEPVARQLSIFLNRAVRKVDDCVDIILPNDQIILLENLRFHAEEEANNEEFAKKLIGNCHIYVNDAFGVCHRKHASVHAITKFIPGCAGLLLEKEIRMLNLENAERPFVAILGGAKLSTKLKIIKSLLQKVDCLLIGGAMMFTFVKARGYNVGNSLVEDEFLPTALELLRNPKLVLPADVVVADKTDSKAKGKIFAVEKMPKGMIGLDIGPKSIELFKEKLVSAKTVVWNGPLGYYENPNFALATNEIARFTANLKARTIVGGGDSVDAINNLGLAKKFTHVSTGGGASLSLLAGEEMPGIRALEESQKIPVKK